MTRDCSITYMKAIAIVLMVLGHAAHGWTGFPLEGLVGMFHMPIFFFVSGYCFKEKYLYNVKDFLWKRFKKIWIVTFLCITSSILLHNMFISMGIYGEAHKYDNIDIIIYDASEIFKRILFAFFALKCDEYILLGLWFMRYLFIASIFCLFFIKYMQRLSSLSRTIAISLFILSCFIVSFLSSISFCPKNAYLPLLSSFYFLFGYFFKKKLTKFDSITRSGYMSVLYCLVLIFGFFFCRFSMLSIVHPFLPMYIVVSIAGILLVRNFSFILEKKADKLMLILSTIGDNTIYILMLHALCFKFITMCLVILKKDNWDVVSWSPLPSWYSEEGWFVLYVISAIFIPIFVKYFKDKVCITFTNVH